MLTKLLDKSFNFTFYVLYDIIRYRTSPIAMPMHKGLLPREGLCADVILKLVRRTLLNPNLLLPLLLLARYTKKGQDLSILHPKAARRLRLLFYVAVARGLSGWLSDKVRNNWVGDRYDWSKEIVLITGGAAGIGASIVKLLDELKVRVVVLDVQRMTYTACKSSRPRHSSFSCIALQG